MKAKHRMLLTMHISAEVADPAKSGINDNACHALRGRLYPQMTEALPTKYENPCREAMFGLKFL